MLLTTKCQCFVVLLLYALAAPVFALSGFFDIRGRSQQKSLPIKAQRHTVDGIDCVEVPIPVDKVGWVSILEATAESQELLVDMALEDNKVLPQSDLQLNAGDPYGAVLWPAASAVANRLLATSSQQQQVDSADKKKPLQGMSVLELGAGTGLVSIAASLGGADQVIATDYEQIPLQLLEYAARCLNPPGTPIETALLDMCDFETPLPPADLVVAADVMYEPKTGAAVAKRVVEALKRGSRALVGDSPGRAGRPAFLQELKRLGVCSKAANFVDAVGRTCSGPRHELICGKESISVSETPQELTVAIMDLDPSTCFVKETI